MGKGLFLRKDRIMKLEFCCPTLFGLEGIVADELRYEGKIVDVRAENGRVCFTGNEYTLAWANINLRCAERVLIRMASFHARTFDDLFEGTRMIDWGDWIPLDGNFLVKGYSLNSVLHSVPACQSIVKKAIATSLGTQYGIQNLPETGQKYQIQFSIMKDKAEIFLDTSGAGLHKRGYRANSNLAPLRETLAAAMVKLARWKGREPLFDPFCGSGTIPIEAAMIAAARAPGLLRSFDSERWESIDHKIWDSAREKALSNIKQTQELKITGSDIDPVCVALSQQNAHKAKVADMVTFCEADATKCEFFQHSGTLFANPPYGERLLDQQRARDIYASLGALAKCSSLKQYYLTSDPDFEQIFGIFADKKRKLYNGMIKCNLYMYFQPIEKRRKYVRNAKG